MAGCRFKGVSSGAAAIEGGARRGATGPGDAAGTGRGCCECPPVSAGLTRRSRSALQPAIYRGAP